MVPPVTITVPISALRDPHTRAHLWEQRLPGSKWPCAALFQPLALWPPSSPAPFRDWSRPCLTSHSHPHCNGFSTRKEKESLLRLTCVCQSILNIYICEQMKGFWLHERLLAVSRESTPSPWRSLRPTGGAGRPAGVPHSGASLHLPSPQLPTSRLLSCLPDVRDQWLCSPQHRRAPTRTWPFPTWFPTVEGLGTRECGRWHLSRDRHFIFFGDISVNNRKQR